MTEVMAGATGEASDGTAAATGTGDTTDAEIAAGTETGTRIADEHEPLVRTTDAGAVRGVVHRGTLQWRGIPYAAPPVGELRWRAPRPVTPWDGVRDATAYAPAAPQPVTEPMAGVGPQDPTAEDCLYLDVVVPGTPRPDGAPRPVIVWIHGGAFIMGAGSAQLYRGTNLAPQLDVVHVSIGYRLGVLGWLDLRAFGTPARPVEANLGLRDQLAALEWVRRNIAEFGGDPDNVTVMGESAGAASVLALLASPASDGLFARAISQSGLLKVPSPGRVADLAGRFADLMDELDGGVEGMFDADVATLVTASERLLATTPGLPFGPVADDVLSADPLAALRDGSGAGVPLLIGTNRDEGKFFQKHGDLLPTSPARIEALLGDGREGDAVRAAYPGYARRRSVAARLGGDWTFWTSTVAVAEAHAASGAPVWMYRFDFAPPAIRLAGLGATHGMEIPYLFGARSLGRSRHATSLGGARAAAGVQSRMQAVWSGFASRGEAPWRGYDATRRATWVFDARDHLVEDPDALRREAWQSFAATYQG